MTTEMDTAKLAVPRPLAQAMLDYLKKRPFEEVFQLVNAFMQCPLVLDVPPVPEVKSEEAPPVEQPEVAHHPV